MPRLIVDGQPAEFTPGESVLLAMLRAGRHPTGGGCLCLQGDCPHCLATVDGVAYTRTCQTLARPGMRVESHPRLGNPPLPAPPLPTFVGIPVRHLHCDVVVIGQGRSGRAAAVEALQAGKEVVTLEARDGQEVVGLYPGPLVVARTVNGMLHVHPRQEVVVATGAAEIQPVAPGSHLLGIITARAAAQLQAAGIELGRLVALGQPPAEVPAEVAQGELVRFEGEARVEALVVRGADGAERRLECDTVAVGLGFSPRDTLLRMGQGLPVRAVGAAARAADLPACPRAGTVCPCSSVSVADLERVWEAGFRELELVKRATLAGTGPCQGAACVPHIRSFLREKGGALQPAFTARPVNRQLTLEEAAAGAHLRASLRTALDGEHRRLGARMERLGGWWRPWHYGDPLAEYWAVREAVSVGDVSTLGKMRVAGPDALELLERLYPTRIASLAPGRARYVLLLDERGYVLDDGMVACDSPGRYTLTFTSGGASAAEMWVRDWAESWKLDVRLLNQTMSLGAINVTGPLARQLLGRAGLASPPPYLGHAQAEVAGVTCQVFRLSFTGEVSFELHHPAEHSATLWRRLLELGADLGLRPHGLQTLLRLRLEKGHIIVGQDTDFDSTPRRLGMEWAVRLDKGDFVGRAGVLRTDQAPPDRQLVGLETESPAPPEGAVLRHGAEYAGYVTSSAFSPALGRSVMLAWLRLFDGTLPAEATLADGRTARRVPLPFYDPEAIRARA